jgi:hypothetical protein
MLVTARRIRRPMWHALLALGAALMLASSSVLTASATEGSGVFTAAWVSEGDAFTTIDVPGGETSATLRISNVTEPGEGAPDIASVSITPPAGYTVEGGSVELTELSIEPGGSLDVPFDVTTPCLPDEVPNPWTVVAKDPSDASFALADGAVAPSTTRDETSCKLRFTKEPNTTKTNNVIKNGFNSTGDLVTVEIYDPVTSDVVDSDATVTLVPNKNPAGGALSGGSEDASSGTATFPSLALNRAGSYTLEASSDVTVNTPETHRFLIADTVSTCSGNGCKFTETQGGNSYTTTPQSGTAGAKWATSLNLNGVKVSCNFAPFNYPEDRQPNSVWYVYDDGATGSAKTNVIRIAASIVKKTSDNGASKYRVCYSSPVQFTDRTGNPAQPDPWGAQGPSGFFGETWYTGLLPDCQKKPVAPCVLSWTGASGGDRTGTFLTPKGDPFFR